jgi:hypothetical protein
LSLGRLDLNAKGFFESSIHQLSASAYIERKKKKKPRIHILESNNNNGDMKWPQWQP